MKSAVILIIFTFLLAFALQATAQDEKPKIVWKNLQDKYKRFEDIKPQILNESNFSIYFDSYYFPYVDFERFDEKLGSWKVSRVWHCGTGYKPQIRKIKSLEQISLSVGNDDWYEITTEDSIGEPKFRRFPDYNGTGKYRFKFEFGLKKSGVNQLVSYSPEFEVIEKDFRK